MAAPLEGLSVRFFTNDITPSPDDLYADYTIAALGTAGTALDALEGPINLPGDRMGMHQEITVIAGASPTSETILGAVVYLPGSPNVLKGAVRFPEPVPIANEGDYVSFDVVIALPLTLATGL